MNMNIRTTFAVFLLLITVKLSRCQRQNLASVTTKLDLLEAKVRGQADEISQLKLKFQIQEAQLTKANVQLQYLLQAIDNDKNEHNSLNVTKTIEEIDQQILRLESELTASAAESDKLITRGDRPQTICFRSEVKKSGAATALFQQKAEGHVILTNTTCVENDNSRRPFLLFCGGKHSSTLKNFPCQCPSQQGLNSVPKSSQAKKKKSNQNKSEPPSVRANQLLCANYSNQNLVAVARFLLPHSEDSGTTNALLIFCRFYSYDNLIDIAHQLIIGDSSIVKATTANKDSALMLLCKHFNSDKIVEVADLMIENGVDIGQMDKDGNTALTLLCSKSQNKKIVKMAELLIEKGIDPNQANSVGDNALICLCQHSKSDKIFEMAELLFDKGIDVNHRNNFGENALIALCWSSDTEEIYQVAERLIAEGIDVNHENNLGNNALMRLCEHSESEKIVQLAQLLIENGVDIDGTNYDRENALIKLLKYSKNNKILEVAELLIAKGINVNQKDKYGEIAADYLNARSTDEVPNKSQILKLTKKKRIT